MNTPTLLDAIGAAALEDFADQVAERFGNDATVHIQDMAREQANELMREL